MIDLQQISGNFLRKIKNMKLLFLLAIPFLFLSCGKTASQNSVMENGKFQIYQDTFFVDIKGELTHALKYQGKFYCLFTQKMVGKYGGYPQRWIYVFTNKGKIENKIDFPKNLDCVYLDFFAKHDSIILNPYMEDESYYLDLQNNKWIKIDKTDDLVFEDENYLVYSRDFGEWGGKTWFKDKKTGIEYVTDITTPLVNKIDTTYFLTNEFRIIQIDNPKNLTKCESNVTYENIENEHKYTLFYLQPVGFQYLYNDTAYDYFDFSYKSHIVTSFVHNDSLFHIYETDTVIYLATIDSNKIKSILPIENNLRFFNQHESYRCKNLNGQNELLKFRTKDKKISGLLEITNNEIIAHYFTNKAELKPKIFEANEADNIFGKRLDFILSNLENLPLEQVYKFEQNLKSFEVTPNHNVGIGESYYPNQNKHKIESCKSYLIKENSLISNTVEYFYSKDNFVRVVLFEWEESDFFADDNKNKIVFKDKLKFLENKIADKAGKAITNEQAKKIYEYVDDDIFWKTESGFVIILEKNNFNRIRLIIYKE
ncbi:MAG: hypothetical protein LBG77_08490 [Dysgonamonadaceae bacterium]|jgi:hypothetical protein|nr:hypothetical protein [Dysgonamonadaceae bacterium]